MKFNKGRVVVTASAAAVALNSRFSRTNGGRMEDIV